MAAKIPSRFAQYQRPYITHSIGEAPHHEYIPAPYLPVEVYMPEQEWWVVLRGGRIAGLNYAAGQTSYRGMASTETRHYLVYANRGTAVTLTYGANDIGIAEDIDSKASLVASTGVSSATLTANYPIGWYEHDLMCTSFVYNNFEPQRHAHTLNRGYIEVPVLDPSVQTGWNTNAGDFVVPSNDGRGLPVPYTTGMDIRHICGRVIVYGAIPTDDSLNLVATAGSHRLAGSGTSGHEQHLDAYRLDAATTLATNRLRINITALG